MSKTIKVLVTLTPEQKEEAKRISLKLLGRENISGLYQYFITKYLLTGNSSDSE